MLDQVTQCGAQGDAHEEHLLGRMWPWEDVALGPTARAAGECGP